jgi:hypothetical protein
MPSVVRIHHPPPEKDLVVRQGLFLLNPPLQVDKTIIADKILPLAG